MFRWLKHHFIPHKDNNHRPRLLRPKGAYMMLVAVLFIELFAFVAPTIVNLRLSGGLAAVLPAILGELSNEERTARNLPALAISPLLTRAAEMKAADMAEKGYFAHTSPDGKTPWYWLELAGYAYEYAGENLAVNFRDSKDVTTAWLRSTSHRDNIVKANYTEMGTGIARGLYKGKSAVFVVQVYANPLKFSSGSLSRTTTEPLQTEGSNVLGASTETVVSEKPAFWQLLLASPRRTANTLLTLVFGAAAMALLIYTAIKIRGRDHDLVWNGLAVLAILGACMVANYYWSYRSMVITQSYDYALEDII